MTTVEIVTGPMFAGKTSEGIRRGATLADVYKGKCLFLTHCLDDRPDITCKLGISSHSAVNSSLPKDKFTVIKTNNLVRTIQIFNATEKEERENIMSIIVDEAQFFDPEDIQQFVNLVVRNHLVRHLCICGLDGTGDQKPFTDWISRVTPMAERIVKIAAICMSRIDEGGNVCGKDAYFTIRKCNNAFAGDIGGAERWIAVCKAHMFD